MYMYNNIYYNICLTSTVILQILSCANSVTSQIVPDASLPNKSSVIPQGNINFLEGGTQTGNNLFHSFKEFSVPTGSTAYFNNSVDIQNIFTRVTGNSITNIDGLLKANGSANLFLLNPNGIIFGKNAQLNIGGSFIATTANSFKFGNLGEFSAINPGAPPLLTINVPIGLQFGTNPGKIVVQGTGNNLKIDDSYPQTDVADLYFLSDRPGGLEVKPEKTLALVGGEILLDGGNLTAPHGRIELGSVAAGEQVNLTANSTGFILGYAGVNNFSDIRLQKAASVSTSGESGGNIQIQGKNLFVNDGSAIFGMTLGNSNGGEIKINTSESVEMSGANPQNLYSLIVTESYPNSTGKSGDISINTQKLLIRDGALIFSSPFATGDGGNVNIRASELVQLTGVDPDGYGSFLGTVTPVGSKGNAGNLTVETGRLVLQNGALVSSATGGTGNSGFLQIKAKESVEISGTDGLGVTSRLQTQADKISTGNAGNLSVETKRLTIQDGGQISTDNSGSGSAGNLTIKATESIAIIGTSPDGQTASLINASTQSPTGISGNLNIETGRLTIKEGLIAANSFSSQNAGNINIKATDAVEIFGDGKWVENLVKIAVSNNQNPGLISGIFTVNFGLGNAGNITINTNNFTAANGAFVISSNLQGNQGGSINLNAQNIQLNSSGLITANQLNSMGVAGDITINTQNLLTQDRSLISTSTLGPGRGGDLTINARGMVKVIGGTPYEILGIKTNTNIGTSASITSPGQAGDLAINTASLIVENGGNINSSTSGIGRGGSLKINATDAIMISGQDIGSFPSLLEAMTMGSGDAGQMQLITNRLVIQNGGLVSVSSRGIGKAGNLEIFANHIKLDNQGNLSGSTNVGDRGNITIQAQDIQLNNSSSITTDAYNTATGGNIKIKTDTLAILNGSKITANAIKGQGGNIQINTQGNFISSDSKITASSEYGLAGIVDIKNPNSSPNQDRNNLPYQLINESLLIANACQRVSDNTFYMTGRGGLPISPIEMSNSYEILTNMGVEKLSINNSSEIKENYTKSRFSYTLATLEEATGWTFNPQGQIVLTTTNVNSSNMEIWQKQSSCKKF